MVTKRKVAFFLSAMVTIFIFSWILSRTSIDEVFNLIFRINKRALILFFVLSLATSLLRTGQYLTLIRHAGFIPPNLPLFLIVLVRNFFSDLLPARLGTLVYIFLVNNRLKIPLAVATSTFASSFLFDILALAPLVIIALFFASAVEVPIHFLLLAAGILGLFVLLLLQVTDIIFFSLAKCFGRSGRIQIFLFDAAKDLRSLKRSKIQLRVFVLSILVRISKYASLYVLLYAMLSPLGYGINELQITKVFLGICAAELSASLPISGIAGFGLYEGTWAVVFKLLGFPENTSLTTSIAHHLFTQIYGYSLGALAILILLLPRFEIRKAKTIANG